MNRSSITASWSLASRSCPSRSNLRSLWIGFDKYWRRLSRYLVKRISQTKMRAVSFCSALHEIGDAISIHTFIYTSPTFTVNLMRPACHGCLAAQKKSGVRRGLSSFSLWALGSDALIGELILKRVTHWTKVDMINDHAKNSSAHHDPPLPRTTFVATCPAGVLGREERDRGSLSGEAWRRQPIMNLYARLCTQAERSVHGLAHLHSSRDPCHSHGGMMRRAEP